MPKRLYGIIGHPVKHSLSPAMQNAAFKESGIDAEYSVFDVEPEELDRFLGDIRRRDISGLNVTIPHKINAKLYVEKRGSLDANAKKLGAINTILSDGGTLKGYNTDGPGFYRSLVEELKFEPEGREIFVLGAGGAATAVVMYLGDSPERIYVFDVDAGKTESLKAHFSKYYDKEKLEIVDRAGMKAAMASSQLFVNATPIGMNETDPLPIDGSLLHPGLNVYDLVYNRPVTGLVKEAMRRKLHAVTGLGMLLHQGAISFEIWTGRKAPLGVMRRALREALKES